MSPDTPDNKNEPVGSTVAEETTRIEAVTLLQGATGHGMFSLTTLVVAVVLVVRQRASLAAVAGLVAYGFAINGLSIYLWDQLRLRFHSYFERTEPQSSKRELSPPPVSAELKSEIAAGGILTAAIIAVFAAAVGLYRTLGVQQTALIAAVLLAAGNLTGLVWSVYRYD